MLVVGHRMTGAALMRDHGQDMRVMRADEELDLRQRRGWIGEHQVDVARHHAWETEMVAVRR